MTDYIRMMMCEMKCEGVIIENRDDDVFIVFFFSDTCIDNDTEMTNLLSISLSVKRNKYRLQINVTFWHTESNSNSIPTLLRHIDHETCYRNT